MLLGLYLKLLCVREGELYLPDSFLQLCEINEIISALCTVCSLFVHNMYFLTIIIIIIIIIIKPQSINYGTKNTHWDCFTLSHCCCVRVKLNRISC